MAIANKLNELITQRNNLADNLNTKGVNASQEETLTTLVPKVLDIQSGGGTTVEKGLVINAYNSNGYVTDVSIVGMSNIVDYYCYNNANGGFFTKVVNVKMPDILSIIQSYAFYNCTNLALSELPNNVFQIWEYVFYNCTNLALTELPSGIITIGNYCFYNCTNLALTELPSGITSINQYTFRGCSKIIEMTCNGAISLIQRNAFSNCSNLSKFVLPNVTNVPTLSATNAFTNTPIASGTGYIYVPDDLVESFKSASNWSTYANQIKGVSEL